jgi:FkbM family methyltransferase
VLKSLIFDIGCHEGEDSDYYLTKGFRVVTVEANPELCEKLKKRFSQQIANERFTLVEKAIAERAGETEFFINLKTSIWGTIKRDVAEKNDRSGRPSERIVVSSIRFSSLIEQFGVPYYMKVDIEGADKLCLEGLLPFTERPRFIYIEMDERSPKSVLQAMKLFRRLGYRKFKIVEQGLVPQQIPPRPEKEGIYVDYRFHLGSSGLFGEELEDWGTPTNTTLADF